MVAGLAVVEGARLPDRGGVTLLPKVDIAGDGTVDVMTAGSTAVVTGAFGFTSRRVAERLLADGHEVRTLTGHPDPGAPFADEIRVEPYNFDDPAALAASLEGAETLYNTYWVRCPEQGTTFDRAVENSRTLVEAAEAAGLRRIVHFSVSNARSSDLPYFRGKARVETIVEESALGHAILRPTLIFGRGDRLVNNLAWFLRQFPVFPIFGDGSYRVRPVHVDDVAELAVDVGTGDEERTVDVAGPESFAFESFLRHLANGLGVDRRFVHVPPRVGHLGAKALGLVLDDVVLTRNEIRALMDGLLDVDGPAAGETRLVDWLDEHGHDLGREYARFLRE